MKLVSSWDQILLVEPELGEGSEQPRWASVKGRDIGTGRKKSQKEHLSLTSNGRLFVVHRNHRIWLGRKFSARSCMQIGHQVMAKICGQMEVPVQFMCLQGLSKLQEAIRSQGFRPQKTEDKRCSLCLPAQPPACPPPPTATHPEPDQHPSSLLLRSGRDSEIA